jgi:hypothetical protein
MHDFMETDLWKTTFFSENLTTREREDAAKLTASYQKLEQKIAPLLATIPESCKDLTMHDISHVHQLWDVASEICGPNYPINPLEGFILGAAFLIHDAGLTAKVYPGGEAGIKETKYYKDRVAALIRSATYTEPSSGALENPDARIAERALFDTLRAIHAKRAETLLEFERPHPITGQVYRLLDDTDVLFDCGEIIGLIAASHHWDIREAEQQLFQMRTPPAEFPRWSIQPLKLACILRAADACAIDERRARTMPFLLTNPSGISKDHWCFQAYLNPGRVQDGTLVFQSKTPFVRAHMSSWWTAYDAIEIADQELRNCNKALKRNGSRSFAANSVEGAGDPTQLKENIRVSGWEPVNTTVRIDDPVAVVERFGGWQLYGDDSTAPLRELIQNAADSIRARRQRPDGFDQGSAYPGRIDVSFDVTEDNGKIETAVMTVADDGIGMSPDILISELLDFGRSFWNSEKASRIYPGLLSDPSFEPTGRFGIGFFAIFMIAENVKVISRPFRSGIRDAKTLHFGGGLNSRAELREYIQAEDGQFPHSCSTIIRTTIKNTTWLDYFCQKIISIAEQSELRSSSNNPIFSWDRFERTLSRLVFALDVETTLRVPGKASEKVNRPDVMTMPPEEFVSYYNSIMAGGNPRTLRAAPL